MAFKVVISRDPLETRENIQPWIKQVTNRSVVLLLLFFTLFLPLVLVLLSI